VKANKAPQPVEGYQWRWDATEVAQWVQSRNVPSVAEIEKDGKLVTLLRSGVGEVTVRDAIAKGLLSEADVEEIRVRVERRRSPMVRPVKFIRVAVVAILRDIETGNRSFAQRKRWEPFETIREGDDLLLSLRAALVRMNLSKRQFYRLCESEKFGVTYRDRNGKRVLPPPTGTPAIAGEGSFEYYYLSELEECDNARKGLKFEVTVERDKAYSLKETARLTGLPNCRLKSIEIAKALGLIRVKIRVRSACKRKEGKRGKDEWNRSRLKVGFTKKSVDDYMQAHPKLTELCVRADETKAEDAAQTLGMNATTVVQWWHAGLLDGEKRKCWTDAGVREGLSLKNTSVDAAKIIFDRVGGSVRDARRLLMASRDQSFWPDHKCWLTTFEIMSKYKVDSNRLRRLCQRDWPELPTGTIRVEHVPKRAVRPSGKRSASSTPLFHPDDIAHAAAVPDGRTKEARSSKAQRSQETARAVPPIVLTAGPPDARAAELAAKYPRHVKKPYTTGRPPDKDREPILEFCYDEYVAKRRGRKAVWVDSKKEFGPSAPRTKDDVRPFALNWADRFEPPLRMDRNG
jgi:hypothetical protein